MKNKKGFMLSALISIFVIGVSIPLFMTNHKKVKADTISDLTNTTWTFNSALDLGHYATYYINFSSNSSNYTYIFIDFDDYYLVYYNNTLVYDGYDWVNNSYKIINITGGTDVTNSTLIWWLNGNATLSPPTPSGTQIIHKYWSPYGAITMQNNDRIGDSDIQYTVLFNEYTSIYDETTQTGLYFLGVQTEQSPSWSYIESINGEGVNILYHGVTNNINNAMWLEFTPGDYLDTDLYDLMSLWGHWFDDDDAYLVGINQGYVEGLQTGRSLGQADGVEYTNLITRIFNGLANILNIEVFPNITIGLIIGLPLLLGVFIIIIKILRG